MNHEKASTLAAQYASNLLIDAYNPAMPDTFTVRKVKDGMPFNIHMVSVDPSTVEPIKAVDAKPEQQSVKNELGFVVTPYEPARPAIPGKSAAEIIDEYETKAFTDALASAKKTLGA